MYKWIITSAIFFALLLGVFYTPYSANAVSAYDDLIVPVNDVIIDDSTCDPQSLAIPWSQVFSGTTGTFGSAGGDLNFEWTGTALTNFDDIQSLWLNTVPDGSWGVSQVTGGGSDRFINVWFTDYEDVDAQFTNSGEPYNIRSLRVYRNDEELVFDDHIYSIFLAYKNNGLCDTVTISDPFSSTAQIGIIAQDLTLDVGVYGIQPLFANIDIVYPEGYDGEELPDSWNPPAPPLDWIPDIQHVQSIDWKIKLQDRNFNTFDPVPFTCNQGLTPVIQYDLFNNDTNEEIDTGVFSPSIQYEFQAEKYGTETEFKFIGNYYCGGLEDDPTFSGQTTYYFTLNASGTFVPDTPSCFSDTFPYIDIDGCTSVIEDLVNNLSFGTINFPEWEINSDGCHTLGILGDWINVPSSSRTICPQFSPTVRNVVTPFLTFVLGITIIGVLVTKSRNDFN